MPSTELRRRLGDALYMLSGMVSSRLVEAEPLCPPGWPGAEPRAFRLRYEDGRTLKGRRFASASRAAAVHDLSRRMDRAAMPVVIARLGDAMLSEWVEGEPLDGAAWDPDLLRACGRLHGRLHETPVPGGRRSVPGDPVVDGRSRLARDLTRLCAAGLIADAARRRLVEAAGDACPAGCQIAVVHGDFCAENLVITSAGEPRPVDNEGLGIGAREYDLARTWYRWPMTAAQRRVYLEGYASPSAVAAFAGHFSFWYALAVVDAAIYRYRLDPRAAAVPLDALHAFLARLDAGTPASELITACGRRGSA